MTSLRNTSTCVREALKIGYCGPARSTSSLSHSGRPIGELLDRLSQPLDPGGLQQLENEKKKNWGRDECACRSPDSEAGYDVVRSPLRGDLLEGGLHMTNGVPYV